MNTTAQTAATAGEAAYISFRAHTAYFMSDWRGLPDEVRPCYEAAALAAIAWHEAQTVAANPSPRFKVGDRVRFKFRHPDVSREPFAIIETKDNSIRLDNGCWYGEGAFELVESSKISKNAPRIDTVARAIGSLAAQWKSGSIYTEDFSRFANAALDDARQLEHELASALARVKELEAKLPKPDPFDEWLRQTDIALNEPRYADCAKRGWDAAMKHKEGGA